MKMKPLGTLTSLLAAGFLAFFSEPSQAAPVPVNSLTPRRDINPAVLYWQAFSLYPDLADDRGKDFLADPPRMALHDAELLIKKLDGMFKFLGRAARMKAPCDWGIDLADGPETIMPNIIKIRQSAHAARARAFYHLAAGRDQAAVDDLTAVLVLGRHAGSDSSLVGTMVGLSIEDFVVKFVADHFFQFGPDAMQSLRQQLESAPRRPTVRQAMTLEKAAFWGWFVARIEALRAAHPQDEARVLESIRALLISTLDGSGEIDAILAAAGGTPAGVLAYFREVEPLYDSIVELAETAPAKLDEVTRATAKMRDQHPNKLARMLFPNVSKARHTELGIATRTAMLLAAIELQLHGNDAFQRVSDPLGNGPFQLTPFAGEDGRAGFELDSRGSAYGLSTRLPFVQKKSGAPLKPTFE
jgi:hypothetical protein